MADVGMQTIVVRRTDASGLGAPEDDRVVVEEPLEIRIAGETLAITMRTPGHDRELVLGFLFAEGIITGASDVSSLAHCGRLGDPATDNTVEVTLAPGVRSPIGDDDAPGMARRGTLVSSACGVCGRRTIDDLIARLPACEDDTTLAPATLLAAVQDLRARQPLFERTGGCHAASLVSFDGTPVATFEDVGRHNAVDKVVGAALRDGRLPLTRHALVVSGRSSFEIVQKAALAGVGVVASVSAPSSLAVSLATRANLTLVGFVRDAKMTVYAGEGRLSAP